MTEVHATIEGSAEKFENMVELATMAKHSDYEQAYLIISDGEVEVVSSAGFSASSYSNFTEEYFTTIEARDGGAEAIIDIEKFQFYLDLVAGAGNVEVQFRGEPDSRLATVSEMHGELNTSVHIPSSETIIEQMPSFLPESFTEDGVYTSKDGDKQLQTVIEVSVETIERVMKPVESEEYMNIDNYPIVVEDGSLQLQAGGKQSRDRVWGELEVQSVEGPDVANLYGDPFKPVFESLSGDVTIQTSPGGAPLAVVKEIEGGTIRHVVGPAGTMET